MTHIIPQYLYDTLIADVDMTYDYAERTYHEFPVEAGTWYESALARDLIQVFGMSLKL